MNHSNAIQHLKAARPLIMGQQGVIASGHPLASLTGMKILQSGGNAVDAAVAAGFSLAVLKPEACGVGGDLFALVFMKKTGKVEALNASGPAPAHATMEFFKSKKLAQIPTSGPLSIAVPGAVDGWLALRERYGTLGLAELCSDALQWARHGFPLYLSLSHHIAELAPSCPDVDRCFRQSLTDLSPGRILAQQDLARTLEAIVEKGRDGFYGGDVAARLCAGIRQQGGLLDEKDLAETSAQWLEPLRSSYRGYELLEQPPVSQGFMVLEMMNIIENFPWDRMAPWEFAHVMIEAKKQAFADRNRYLEDPSFGDPCVPALISKEHGQKRSEEISAAVLPSDSLSPVSASDTTYLCVADAQGNVVSLIESVFSSFGSRVVAGDTGVVMNNRLCSFLLDPDKANALAPGKRPAHTLNSYMVFRDGHFFAVGGTPGADDQPQTNVQVLHNLLDHGMDPQSALEAPRWSHRPGTHPNAQDPEVLRMEGGFSDETVAALRAKGHPVNVVEPWSFGGAALIVKDPHTGTWFAAADPRREGYALGW